MYGVLHEAQTYAQRNQGVVVCNPFGHEYVRSHRACCVLANRLAQAGFPVLRFDYRGTGDSAGDAENWGMADWSDDINRAVDMLCDRTGVEYICLLGLRLGASLALPVAATRHDVSALILWEPIVSGIDYITELTDQHRELLWRHFDRPEIVASQSADELLGFPIPPSLRHELENLNLCSQPLSPQVTQMLLVENHSASSTPLLLKHLRASGSNVTHLQIPSFATWREDVDKGLVPEPVIRGIVTWASETML
jgi:pimeloyl-ACP methyl ester carboxylesterase